MAFEGFLRGLQLHELLQLAAGSRKTGMFVFNGRDGGRGRVYLFQGQVVHAECRSGGGQIEEGEDALGRLSLWEGGRFEFVAGAVTGRKTVSRGTTAILLEAARRQDESSMGGPF